MTCFHHTRKLLQMEGKQKYKRGQSSGGHHAISRPTCQSNRVCTGDFQAAREGKWKRLCRECWAWTCCAVKWLQSYARVLSPRWTRAGLCALHRALLLLPRERTLSPIPGDTLGHRLLHPLPTGALKALKNLHRYHHHLQTTTDARQREHLTLLFFSLVSLLRAFENAVTSFAASQRHSRLQSSNTGGHQYFLPRKQTLTQVFLCTHWWIWHLICLSHSDIQKYRCFPLLPYRGRGKERWRWRRFLKS